MRTFGTYSHIHIFILVHIHIFTNYHAGIIKGTSEQWYHLLHKEHRIHLQWYVHTKSIKSDVIIVVIRLYVTMVTTGITRTYPTKTKKTDNNLVMIMILGTLVHRVQLEHITPITFR